MKVLAQHLTKKNCGVDNFIKISGVFDANLHQLGDVLDTDSCYKDHEIGNHRIAKDLRDDRGILAQNRSSVMGTRKHQEINHLRFPEKLSGMAS